MSIYSSLSPQGKSNARFGCYAMAAFLLSMAIFTPKPSAEVIAAREQQAAALASAPLSAEQMAAKQADDQYRLSYMAARAEKYCRDDARSSASDHGRTYLSLSETATLSNCLAEVPATARDWAKH
jgi:hypothetical protein